MDHDKQNPPTDQQADPSKAQNQQQPAGQQNQNGFTPSQQPEGQSQQQPPEGQADYGSAGQSADQNTGQSDTATQQRSDIEGGTSTGQETDIEGSSQFVGSKSASDTSSELIEDDDSSDFAKDGQGAPE